MARPNKKVATPTVAPVTAAQVTQPAVTMEPVQLTIADLQLLARIIDLASRRGAFQATEMSQVGDSYNKLAGFLAYVESVQPKEKPEHEETTQEAVV